jgi:hypothetical protein
MKTQLAIEISENGVNFAHIQDGDVLTVDEFLFKDKIDYRYKEQLEQIFQEKGYKEKEYDEYTLSWYSIILHYCRTMCSVKQSQKIYFDYAIAVIFHLQRLITIGFGVVNCQRFSSSTMGKIILCHLNFRGLSFSRKEVITTGNFCGFYI